jgi:hypothetical protein
MSQMNCYFVHAPHPYICAQYYKTKQLLSAIANLAIDLQLTWPSDLIWRKLQMNSIAKMPSLRVAAASAVLSDNDCQCLAVN